MQFMFGFWVGWRRTVRGIPLPTDVVKRPNIRELEFLSGVLAGIRTAQGWLKKQRAEVRGNDDD